MVREIALDLGTTKVSLVSRGGEFLLSVPSVVATEARTGELIAFGQEAATMVGRAPDGFTVTNPIRNGVIVDFEAAELLVRAFLRCAGVRRIHLPTVVACVPSATTPVERRAVLEAIYRAGASDVRLLGHGLAGALGAGAALDQPSGAVVVDVGGGVVEVAVLSLGGVVSLRSARFGGVDFDTAIVDHMRARRDAVVSHDTAEQIKKDLAVADLRPGANGQLATNARTIAVRRVGSGEVAEHCVTSEDVGDAIYVLIDRIVDLVIDCISEAPPEIATDLIDSGIYLVGGGSQLSGFGSLIAQRTKLPVSVVEDPALATVRGAQHCLGFVDELADLFLA